MAIWVYYLGVVGGTVVGSVVRSQQRRKKAKKKKRFGLESGRGRGSPWWV